MKSGSDNSKLPVPANGMKIAASRDDRDEIDAPLLPAPKPKTGLFPTGLSRAIAFAAILACITWGATQMLTDRYELVASSDTENNYVYRVDRLSGAVSLCSSLGCTDVPDRRP